MPKGITQEQVSAAADALVAASERPTVEKIRAQLGTGSPNTVSRMLEVWRGALATRMGQMLVLPEVPGEVGQAFAEVWRLAVTHAASAAHASLAHEQNTLLAASDRFAIAVSSASIHTNGQPAASSGSASPCRVTTADTG